MSTADVFRRRHLCRGGSGHEEVVLGTGRRWLWCSQACTTTGSNNGPASVVDTASGASHAPVTLNVWSFYSGREFQDYSVVLNEFMAKYP